MAIENTSLWREVQSVLMSGDKPVHFYWTCDIIANKVVVPAIKLLSKDNQRLYDVAFADDTVIEIAMGLGTYSQRVFPYRENLKITLTRYPLGENSSDAPLGTATLTQTYRAVPIGTSNPAVESNHPIVQNEEFADLSNLINVKFQLLDEGIEQIRLLGTGGIYQGIPAVLLQTLLSNARKQVPVDRENTVMGVDLVPPDNMARREHISLRHDLKLVDLADELQSKHGGIYNAGIACYLQNNQWYVYPPYNTERFDTTPNTLTIINVPPQRLPQVERTYRTTGRQVIIIATGDTRHQDLSEHRQLNEGNGVRFNDSSKLYEGFSRTQNNKTTISRAQNANEFQTTQRQTGLNSLRTSEQRFTDNPFQQLSQLAKRDGAYVQLGWEHSESGLLYPGQPVRYLYLSGEDVIETFGVLLRVHEYTHQVSEGVTTRRHISNSALTLFIKRKSS